MVGLVFASCRKSGADGAPALCGLWRVTCSWLFFEAKTITFLQKGMGRLPIRKVPVSSTKGRGGGVHFAVLIGWWFSAGPSHTPAPSEGMIGTPEGLQGVHPHASARVPSMQLTGSTHGALPVPGSKTGPVATVVNRQPPLPS